ncbi:hypothetical protein [Mesorhizobium sp. CN2-181]|uniref:hypothetical protein n=1 Tax=Mesorhizobium yinganensis TaxID=3157707 RepID=UPI0032B7B74D
MSSSTEQLSAEVRIAIGTFLEMCQKEARPFATAEALGAVKRIFVDLDISDAQLVDAIRREAAAVGFDVEAATTMPNTPESPCSREQAVDQSSAAREQTQRQMDNDTSGRRRRAEETAARHRIL